MSGAESNLVSTTVAPGVGRNAEFPCRRDGRLWSSLQEICSLLAIPVPSGVGSDFLFQHMLFKAGQQIHSIGQPFEMLYLVNSGFLKTVVYGDAGNEQVMSFPMRGDLFGIDGIHGRHYTSEASALSNCDIVLIPFRKFAMLGRSSSDMEAAIYGVMSRELAREQAMIGMLGAMGAEGRLARFLVWLAERYSAMGYSGREFNLRMSRQEIGSYLGLTLETVSRTFSMLDDSGIISVSQRAVIIHDLPALKTLRRVPRQRLRTQQPAKE